MPRPERPSPRLIPFERLHRVLGRDPEGRLAPGLKAALFFGVLALIVVLAAIYEPAPSLRHVKVVITSGGASGNYYAVVDRIASEVARQRGRVTNLTSAGSVENVQRLVAARKTCEVQFGLVQDGIDWPQDHGLELIGRLPRPESLIVLGRQADQISSPAQLRGLKVGIGPVGSGTEFLARKVLEQVRDLDLKVSTQSIDRQLDLLERGELDLGFMVIDDQAQLLRDAVARRGLQVLDLPNAGSLARNLAFARVGTIDPGQYDYARQLPASPKRVLQVDALIVGNGCATLSQTQGLMTALTEVFPTFVRQNRQQPNLTGLPMPTVVKEFFADEGPDLLGQFAPSLVDIMPLATWMQLVVAFSLLFSATSLLNRFQLKRIDARRVKIERELPELFGPGATVGDILEHPVDDTLRSPATRARIDMLITRLTTLRDDCRKRSLSVLVPMGEEMSYRYQETLIADLLHALRSLRERLGN
jgi:TRAP-type uncharacterized transport system substrate-binding protein